MPRKRKKRRSSYSAAFKAEAVALVLDHGVSANQAARDLGLSSSTLCSWVKNARAEQGSASSDTLSPSELVELRRLRREVRVLREERDILKKAAAFFARESR